MSKSSKQSKATTGIRSLVSIVTPVFNSERFLRDTIQSVQSQSYGDWELLLIDDASTDGSVAVIQTAQNEDTRIKLLQNERNMGAGYSRNQGIKAATGEYVAFLDADDLWAADKLKKHVAFAEANSRAFTFTAYEFANTKGEPTGRCVSAPPSVTYQSMITNPIAWTSTIMIDLRQVEKGLIYMPDIKRGQDLVAWLNVLRHTNEGYGLNEVLSYYRRSSDSLSANKLKAMKRTWHIYRHELKINQAKSVVYMATWAFNATRKRI